MLLRSLRPELLLRLRRGLQCGLECVVVRSATAEALRARVATSMEFAPWGGRPVSCVSDNQCTAKGGGVLFVKCTWLTGLPDGAEDGRYCTCVPFMRGLTCQDATPVLQLRGFLLVPSALLTVLALWRALRDLRECPREKRASPGALCLMLATCAASSYVLCLSGLTL